MNGDLSVQILREIRDAVRETNARIDDVKSELSARIDGTNARVDSTNTRIDGTNARLEELSRRIVESEIRTATAITDLHGTVREVVTLLRDQHDLRPRLQRCEEQIADLQQRLPG
jgi:chromosome segregation ATPase